MTDISFVGSTVSVSATAPATLNETGFEAAGITYSEITNLQTFGEVGDTHSPIEYQVLKEGRIKRVPGSKDGGAISCSMIYTSGDTGQGIIKTANGTPNVMTFKIKDTDNETYYIRGTIADLRFVERTNTNMKMQTFTVYATTELYGPYSD